MSKKWILEKNSPLCNKGVLLKWDQLPDLMIFFLNLLALLLWVKLSVNKRSKRVESVLL